MDTRTLHLFLHLFETLHFGRTSRECNISPSALSRQISRLEEELGQQLFLRDQRRVVPTRSGEIFRNHALRIRAELEKANTTMQRESRELSGRIRLFCSVTACYSILPDIIPPFRRDYPGIRVLLKTGDAASAIPMVLSGDTDIGVAALPERLGGELAFREIRDTPLVFVAPGEGTEFESCRYAEDLPWDRIPLIVSEKEPSREKGEEWFHSLGISPKVQSFVSGNEAIMAMVGLGLGVGIVPRLVVDKSPVISDVRIMDVRNELGSYTVGLCALRRSLRFPMVKALWDEV